MMNINVVKRIFNYRMGIFEIVLVDINNGEQAIWPVKNNFINFRDKDLEDFLKFNPYITSLKYIKNRIRR